MIIGTLLVVALGPEWAFLRGRFRHRRISVDQPLYTFDRLPASALLQTGPGVANAGREVIIVLREHAVGRVIHFGTAGALDPALVPTTILVANTVISTDTSKPAVACDSETTTSCARRLADANIPFRVGALCTSASVLSNATEKNRVWIATFADAVDMESYAVASLCRDRAIPYTAVRGIFDGAGEDLKKLSSPYDDAGNLSMTGIAADIVRHPSLIMKLPGLKKRMDVIGKRLGLVMEATKRLEAHQNG